MPHNYPGQYLNSLNSLQFQNKEKNYTADFVRCPKVNCQNRFQLEPNNSQLIRRHSYHDETTCKDFFQGETDSIDFSAIEKYENVDRSCMWSTEDESAGVSKNDVLKISMSSPDPTRGSVLLEIPMRVVEKSLEVANFFNHRRNISLAPRSYSRSYKKTKAECCPSILLFVKCIYLLVCLLWKKFRQFLEYVCRSIETYSRICFEEQDDNLPSKVSTKWLIHDNKPAVGLKLSDDSSSYSFARTEIVEDIITPEIISPQSTNEEKFTQMSNVDFQQHPEPSNVVVEQLPEVDDPTKFGESSEEPKPASNGTPKKKEKKIKEKQVKEKQVKEKAAKIKRSDIKSPKSTKNSPTKPVKNGVRMSQTQATTFGSDKIKLDKNGLDSEAVKEIAISKATSEMDKTKHKTVNANHKHVSKNEKIHPEINMKEQSPTKWGRNTDEKNNKVTKERKRSSEQSNKLIVKDNGSNKSVPDETKSKSTDLKQVSFVNKSKPNNRMSGELTAVGGPSINKSSSAARKGSDVKRRKETKDSVDSKSSNEGKHKSKNMDKDFQKKEHIKNINKTATNLKGGSSKERNKPGIRSIKAAEADVWTQSLPNPILKRGKVIKKSNNKVADTSHKPAVTFSPIHSSMSIRSWYDESQMYDESQLNEEEMRLLSRAEKYYQGVGHSD